MKTKLKVAVIMQRTVPNGDGGTDQLTLIKMTPVDLPAGDVLLGFHNAEIDWHPETYDETGPDRNRKLIKANSLIRSVAVTYNGQPFTFVHDTEYVIDISAAQPIKPTSETVKNKAQT